SFLRGLALQSIWTISPHTLDAFSKNSGSASAARCGPGAAKQPSTPGPSLGNLPQRTPEQPGAVRLARIAPLSCSIPFRLPGHLLCRLRCFAPRFRRAVAVEQHPDLLIRARLHFGQRFERINDFIETSINHDYGAGQRVPVPRKLYLRVNQRVEPGVAVDLLFFQRIKPAVG